MTTQLNSSRHADRTPHIAIWGVGAMGSLFSGYLSSVSTVTMIGRWPDQIKTVQRDGLLIHHASGNPTRFFPNITDNPATLPPIDLAFILVKSHQTTTIATDIASALNSDGVVITLQNGVGNVETLAHAVGVERVTQGVTAQGATMLEPGVVRHAGAGLTHIAVLPARAALIEDGIALLNQVGIETHATASAEALIWGKLAVNAGLNPLTALLEIRNGELLTEPQRIHVMIAAAREVEAVAIGLNIQLPYPDVGAHVKEVARITGENISSMWQDIQRRVPTEIEAICGAVVQQGKRLNIPTPVNATLYQLIRTKEQDPSLTPDTVYQALSQTGL